MFVKTYDQTGKEVGQTRLPLEIFGVKMNQDVVHRVVLAQRANQRQITAHTKDRSEVRGGGKKPWRQKGTGRARHGSIRSPLWRGGGVTFGPRKERNFKQKINKKMRRKALFMVLSAKAKDNLLVILSDLKLEKPKTKLIAEVLKQLPAKDSSCLFALPGMDQPLIRASRNIANVRPVQTKDLNVIDLLSHKYLLMPKESINVLKENFLKSSDKEKS